MAVFPVKATLPGGDSLTFTCDTPGVTWVKLGAGKITPQGQTCVYTAPPKYTLWFTREAVLTAEVNGQNAGSAAITLSSAPGWVVMLAGIYVALFLALVIGVIEIWPPPPAVPSLDLSPPVVTIAPGFTQQFEARIWHARDQGVTWTVADGFITPSGLFTAPASGNRTVLTATSSADRNLTQSAMILLNSHGLTLQPAIATVSPGRTISFQAMEYVSAAGAAGAPNPPAPPAATTFEWIVSDPIVKAQPQGNDRVYISAPKQITSLKRVVVTAIDKANPNRQAAAVLYLSRTEESVEEDLAAAELIRDRQLIELVILMGALGALLGASRSLGNFVGNGAFIPRWSLFYLFRPTFGAGLALLVFFGYRIGAVTGVKSTGPADPFAATFVAGMVGLFADTVLQKLKDLITALFPSHDERTDKVTPPAQTPAIASADGSLATGKMTIRGANFVTGATVTFNMNPRATTFVNPNELMVTLDPSDQVGGVKVVVSNPDKGASAAFDGTISA